MTGRSGGLGSLRRLGATPTTQPAGSAEAARRAEPERCEMCAVEIDDRHGHVADLAQHRLLCVCRPCHLLFANEGAGGRYRGVGDQVRRVEGLALAEQTWDALGIPVDVAFFFEQAGQLIAFYPGPAGATESLLDLAAWADVVAGNPVLGTVQPEVEAVLLHRHDDRFSCHLVPVDRCYELVGVVRRGWTGLAGGPEVWREIDGWFARLDAAAVPVSADAERSAKPGAEP